MATTPRQVVASAVEERVLEIVRELLRELGSHQAAEHATLDSSFERDLGLGSLERVELLVRSEARFNLRLPDEIAQRAETPAEWARAILAGGETGVIQKRYRIQQPSREAPLAPVSATDWVEVLRRHAEVEPHRVHIHLLQEESGQDISYGQLLETASSVAAGLAAKGLKRNETVAIMLPTCADFFYAFFGVMLAGGVAVPIYPPARLDKIEEYVRRQVAILRNAEVRFLISFDQVRAVSKIMGVNIPSLIGTTTVRMLREAGAAAGSRLAAEPSDTAFIQYTSGSTGDPKGVVLSQANVLANVRGIGWAVKFRPTDAVVSWLPLYHDMGLIGSWLFSVYFGAPITVMSPLDFLSRPERWLWALHDSRGTLCPAPNFAYELCARKIRAEAIEGLDLSAWRIAINAGEAVLPDTLRRFEERFTPYGFRAESFVPCYGLAESSVALAFPPIDRRPAIDTVLRDVFESEGRAVPVEPPEASDSKVLRFVFNGAPLPGHEVRVVANDGGELGERVQGRILFRGPSRTAGYYRNPSATAAVMTEDGWMDSGDLGYWANGEIVVTGRLKDLIIKGGHNIVPQEIELAAAEVPGVRRGCVAAFGTRDPSTGTERLVVVAETRATGEDERRRIEAAIIKHVDAAAGTPPDKVVLAAPQSIPKTSSGKIRRNQTRLLYENGKLGGGKRSPWVQMARLWLSNLGAWLDRAAERAAARALRAYSSSLLVTASTAAGFLARLAPGRRLAAGIARSAARCILWLSGHRVAVQGLARPEISGERTKGQPRGVMYMANRSGQFDALVFAAAVPVRLLLADRAALEGVPAKTARMLEPLVVPPLDDEQTPPGGTLRERLRRALEEGCAVLVLAEGAAGVAPHLSRFRLDAIHAAVSTSSAIVPVGVRGTSRILQPGGGRVRRGEASIVAGEPIQPESDDQRELVALRERVRDAIAELCR